MHRGLAVFLLYVLHITHPLLYVPLAAQSHLCSCTTQPASFSADTLLHVPRAAQSHLCSYTTQPASFSAPHNPSRTSADTQGILGGLGGCAKTLRLRHVRDCHVSMTVHQGSAQEATRTVGRARTRDVERELYLKFHPM